MGAAAVRAGHAIGYIGAGTVEFLLDRDGRVLLPRGEHALAGRAPGDRGVTGLDLVELQLRVAEGEPLPFGQDDVRLDGHAFEARLYAEDPATDFLPAIGRIALWQPAPLAGVRYDRAASRWARK